MDAGRRFWVRWFPMLVVTLCVVSLGLLGPCRNDDVSPAPPALTSPAPKPPERRPQRPMALSAPAFAQPLPVPATPPERLPEPVLQVAAAPATPGALAPPLQPAFLPERRRGVRPAPIDRLSPVARLGERRLIEPAMGRADKEQLKAAVQAATPAVKDCYLEALRQDPSVAGRVVVSLEIERRNGVGRVIRGEVADSETFSPFLEACVLQKVAGAQFPVPSGGSDGEGDGIVKVRYPFNFDPGGGLASD